MQSALIEQATALLMLKDELGPLYDDQKKDVLQRYLEEVAANGTSMAIAAVALKQLAQINFIDAQELSQLIGSIMKGSSSKTPTQPQTTIQQKPPQPVIPPKENTNSVQSFLSDIGEGAADEEILPPPKFDYYGKYARDGSLVDPETQKQNDQLAKSQNNANNNNNNSNMLNNSNNNNSVRIETNDKPKSNGPTSNQKKPPLRTFNFEYEEEIYDRWDPEQEARDRQLALQFQPQECVLCLEEMDIDFLQELTTCHHKFCRDCLQQYVESKITERQFPIVCPAMGCKKEVSLLDLETFLTPETFDTFQKQQFRFVVERNAQNFILCPTTDCDYICFYDPNDAGEFGCPVCNKKYCFRCKVEYHEGNTCEQYQEWAKQNGSTDQSFAKMARGAGWKQCPYCNVWVEKDDGCNHMSCRCGNEFCYKCGGKWPCKPEHQFAAIDQNDSEDDEYYDSVSNLFPNNNNANNNAPRNITHEARKNEWRVYLRNACKGVRHNNQWRNILIRIASSNGIYNVQAFNAWKKAMVINNLAELLTQRQLDAPR